MRATILHGPVPDKFYTKIPNAILRGALPTRYVGVYGYIASQAHGWQRSETQLAKELSVGRDFVRAALRAMEQAGLLVRRRARNPDGTLANAVWWVSDMALQLRALGIDEQTIARRVDEQAEADIARYSRRENPTQGSTRENVDVSTPDTPDDESFPRSNPMSGKPTLGEPTLDDPHPKKNLVSEDPSPEKNHPPGAPGTSTPPAPRRSPEHGGGQPDQKAPKTTPTSTHAAQQLLSRVLDGVPPAKRPRAQRRVKIERLIAGALDRGWSETDLTAVLGGSLAGVGSVAAVLASRLDGLDTEPPPPPQNGSSSPPWCGKCESPTRRFLTTDPTRFTDAVRRCPDCHPFHVGTVYH